MLSGVFCRDEMLFVAWISLRHFKSAHKFGNLRPTFSTLLKSCATSGNILSYPQGFVGAGCTLHLTYSLGM